ncbi:MAG: hypothetical protein JWP61_1427, partial [Friedmanniella sp.]|nr:hypothetical protein [Friedmanniella sp.]
NGTVGHPGRGGRCSPDDPGTVGRRWVARNGTVGHPGRGGRCSPDDPGTGGRRWVARNGTAGRNAHPRAGRGRAGRRWGARSGRAGPGGRRSPDDPGRGGPRWACRCWAGRNGRDGRRGRSRPGVRSDRSGRPGPRRRGGRCGRDDCPRTSDRADCRESPSRGRTRGHDRTGRRSDGLGWSPRGPRVHARRSHPTRDALLLRAPGARIDPLLSLLNPVHIRARKQSTLPDTKEGVDRRSRNRASMSSEARNPRPPKRSVADRAGGHLRR